MECVCAQQEHIGCAKRSKGPTYNDLYNEARVTFPAVQQRICLSEARKPCSLDGSMH